VEYLLSPDGKLKTKIYNKTNYNTLNPSQNSTTTTAGFSVVHTQSFDELKNIFKKSREDNRPKEIETEPDTNTGDDGISQNSKIPKTY
jgi:hypothetical protein